MNAPASAATLQAADLYWALLDPAPIGKKSIRPEERGYLFESELPVAIEEVQCAYAPLRDGRILACGIERERLAALPMASSRVPDSLPDWLPEDVRAEASTDSLELLHGDFEPVACRRARRAFAAVVAGSVVLVVAILSAGAVARASALDRAIEAADARRDELVRAALAGAPKRPGLPDDLRLVSELRELRGTRSVGAPDLADAAPILAAALGAWPDGVAAQVDSLSVSPSRIAMRGQAITPRDLQDIVDAIEAIPGWRAAQPVFRVAKDGLAFTVDAAADPTEKGTAP